MTKQFQLLEEGPVRTFRLWLVMMFLITGALGCQQDTENNAEKRTDTDSQTVAEGAESTDTDASPAGFSTTSYAGSDKSAARTGPAINVEPAKFDFGMMHQNQSHDAETVITNVGTDTLRIENVRPTCGCTVAELEVSDLAPGASTKLKINFNSKRFSGRVNKLIHIISNDLEFRQVDVVISADVRVAVNIDPPQQFLANRSIPLGTSWSDQVTFTTEEVPELLVELENHNPKVLQVEVHNHVDGNPQKSIMTVTTRADLDTGDYNEIVTVKTNVEQTPSISISIRARVLGNLRVDPNTLNFGVVEGGQSLDGSVTVTAAKSDLAFQITKAEIDIPNLDLRIEPQAPGNEVLIHISGTALTTDDSKAVANRGRMMGFLTLYTDVPSEPMLKVRAFYMLRM